MRRVLVTGSTGLIGRELVTQLLQEGSTVYSVSRSRLDYDNPLLHHIELDFDSGIEFSGILPTEIDAVVHLAQSENFRNFPERALEVFSTNTASTVKLLDWSHKSGVRHFVYASTGGVYSESAISHESLTPLKSPGILDFYFSSKLSSESFVQSYSGLFSVAVLRFFFVYGRNQRRSMLLPRLFDAVCEGKPVHLAGQDGFNFNPVHVSDASNAILQSLLAPKSLVANIAGPDVLSLRQVCELIGTKTGVTPNFDVRSGSSIDYVGDISQMTRHLTPPKGHFWDFVSDLQT